MVVKMKTTISILSAIFLSLILSACKVNVNDPYYQDTTPPSPPSGIIVINGDNRVDLSWYQNRESDISGYNVYYSYSYDGKYTLIGSTNENYFIDDGASNGNTYYYAVAAFDYNGNESELSYDVIYSTPRPEGFNQSILDYRNFPDQGGYSFTTYSTVPYDDNSTDFFFENYNGDFYIDVWDDSEIQDAGSTQDIYDVANAPTGGWSSTKDEVARVGHTYIIWTWDNHYAKIRINAITNDRISFDWAFQLVEGERQLKAGDNSKKKRGKLSSSINR